MMRKLALQIEKVDHNMVTTVGISVTFGARGQERPAIQDSLLLVRQCNSYEILEREVFSLKGELEGLLAEAREHFKSKPVEEHAELNEELGARELWKILSELVDTEVLLQRFNSLSREKRREIADYVFTHCNVFSGVASVFSMRYNNEEARLE